MSVEFIAEVGSNHNGSFATALQLISAAKKAGANCVKFQHYGGEKYGPCAMPREWLKPLQDAAFDSELDFLCSVFDLRTLSEYLEECQPSRVKIASPELTDHQLLRECADAGVEIILSTGMSTKEQIDKAVETCSPAVLLHCLSSYPAPPEELNLRAIRWLSLYGKVGLSDHTLNPVVAPVAATVLGAVMIEKHFTLSRHEQGPDHFYALNRSGFREMTEAVRLCEAMLGDTEKRVQPSEDPTARRTAEWR